MSRRLRRVAASLNRRKRKPTIFMGPPPAKSAAWSAERFARGAEADPRLELDHTTKRTLLGPARTKGDTNDH